MNHNTPGFPILHYIPEFAQTHVHYVTYVIQPSRPLSPMSALALNLAWHQSISKESDLHTRWPKYWSFSFNISPSNEHSGLISFRTDWFDLLAAQGTLKRRKVKWLFRKKNNEWHYILTMMYFYFFKTCFFLHFSFWRAWGILLKFSWFPNVF